MSNNYDNWERLVVAVLRREKDRQLALAPSRESSICSASSSFNFRLDSPVHERSLQLEASSSEVNETDRERLFPSATSSSAGPGSTQIYDFSLIHTATNNFLAKRYSSTSSSSQSWRSVLNGSAGPGSIQIYDFSLIRSATNNFLAKRYSSTSSSSQSWRSVLNGKDVIIFQRKLRKSMDFSNAKQKLSLISKSHYMSIVKLLGVSIFGEHIYLVYDFVSGSDLSLCLRDPRNPDFTVLSTWMSRMQIATDVAHGLDYMHNTAGLSIDMVHKHVKSRGIIVTEPSYNAKICYFGAAELCGETREEYRSQPPEFMSERQFEGVRVYMSPEFKATGIATQKSDVYAFGVVILELLTGQEPETYKFDKGSKNYKRLSIIEKAKEAVEDGGSGGGKGVEMRLRKWVDKRLKDSFPLDVAEKLTRVALQCVHLDPDNRPDMIWVAREISKFYLASRMWSEKFYYPTEISVSLEPR